MSPPPTIQPRPSKSLPSHLREAAIAVYLYGEELFLQCAASFPPRKSSCNRFFGSSELVPRCGPSGEMEVSREGLLDGCLPRDRLYSL